MTNMNSSQGLYRFSCGSLGGVGGCGFAHAGTSYRASSMHGGNTAYHPIPISRPAWLTSDAGAGWGSAYDSHGNIFLERSEKQTMQELNDRLANYLERVHSLEEANTQLEGCIREWHEKRSRGNQYDFKEYEQNITDMHEQLLREVKKTHHQYYMKKMMTCWLWLGCVLLFTGLGHPYMILDTFLIENGRVTNAGIVLQIDNAKMATEDFRIKYETEKALRQSVQSDVENIRKELDNMTIIITDLEMEIEALREDHILKKKKHEEDMAEHSSPNEFKVNVKVNTAPPEDLAKILAGIREDYEAIIEKNSKSLEAWFQKQFGNESTEAIPNQEELQAARKEITELNRTLQTLEIDLQTQLNTKYSLENTLEETRSRYAFQIQSIQQIISRCEEELSELRHDIKRQNNQYRVLLGIKTRLESEISTYRQLLEGKGDGMRGSESSHKEREGSARENLKKIVRDSVDGYVVSTHTGEIKRQV